MDDVIQTLTKKMDELENAIYEMYRCTNLDGDPTGEHYSDTKIILDDVRCLVDAISDKKKQIIQCAIWILDHMQYGFYYSSHDIILAAEEGGKFWMGAANRALSILKSSGIISRRTLKGIDTVYLTESHHKWIIADFDEENEVR